MYPCVGGCCGNAGLVIMARVASRFAAIWSPADPLPAGCFSPTGSLPRNEEPTVALQRASFGAFAIGSQPGSPWRMRSAFLTGVIWP